MTMSNVLWVRVKGHIGQGQIGIPIEGRWVRNNFKLLHFLEELIECLPPACIRVTICILTLSHDFNFLTSGESREEECGICFTWKPLHLRTCCKFAACDDCMEQYCTVQVGTQLNHLQGSLDSKFKTFIPSLLKP